MSQHIFSGGRGSHPIIYYDVWAGAVRNGKSVTVTFELYGNLSDGGYIYNNGPIVFYGGSYAGSTQASTTLKEQYDDNWYAGEQRYRTCTFTIDTSASSLKLFFRIDQGNGFSSDYNLYETSATIDIPAYTAPYWQNGWIKVNPNPCNINSAPIITWGGAHAGSSGILKYDVDVSSSKPGGGWTSWINISGGQSSTSYNEVVLNKMNVSGVKPFVGVAYQYRVRIWDGTSYDTHSGYISTQLNVTFTLPTAPTINWTTSTVKKNVTATVKWNTPSGGSGNITGYNLVIQLMNQNKQTVIATQNYNGLTNNSLSLIPINVFSQVANNEYLKAYIYSKNSWGQISSASSSTYILIKGNQIWIKVNGHWYEGECYIKINGHWVEGLPYIKINGHWVESV